MPEWENELDGEQEISEEQSEQLHAERLDEIEIQIEQDEHPLDVETDEHPAKKKLKRELEAEALARLEDAARTVSDFQNVVEWWDKLDANRERRERYHEVLRNGDDVPLDYGALSDSLCFPGGLNRVLTKQIRRGDFLDAIFNCPYEIHELVTDAGLSEILRDLKDDHKELLFLWAVRQLSSSRIATIRGQTDRNIRKVRTTVLGRIQKKLVTALRNKAQAGLPLTLEEKAFWAANNKTALDESKDD